jgi:phage shock protein A
MSVIAKKLDQVLDRTQKLVDLSKALQEHNDLLNLENQALKVALETSENKRKELDEKLRVLKFAKSLEGSSEKTLDIKQKINEFVRDIDKCIVLLKK